MEYTEPDVAVLGKGERQLLKGKPGRSPAYFRVAKNTGWESLNRAGSFEDQHKMHKMYVYTKKIYTLCVCVCVYMYICVCVLNGIYHSYSPANFQVLLNSMDWRPLEIRIHRSSSVSPRPTQSSII